MSTTATAMQFRDEWRRKLYDAENGNWCCDASKNQAVGKARKQVKRWENWLADNAILSGIEEDAIDDDI